MPAEYPLLPGTTFLEMEKGIRQMELPDINHCDRVFLPFSWPYHAPEKQLLVQLISISDSNFIFFILLQSSSLTCERPTVTATTVTNSKGFFFIQNRDGLSPSHARNESANLRSNCISSYKNTPDSSVEVAPQTTMLLSPLIHKFL